MMFCLTLTGGQTIAATARRIASRSSGPTLSWLVLLRSSVPRSRDSTEWTEASFSSTWSARCQSALTVPLVRWESSISWAKLCASRPSAVSQPCPATFFEGCALQYSLVPRKPQLTAEALGSTATVQLNNLLIVSLPFCINMLQNPWLKDCSPARKMARLKWT